MEKDYHKNYYRNNKERILKSNSKWKESHPEKNKGYTAKFKLLNRDSLLKKKREEYKRLKYTVDKIIIDFYNKKDISNYPLDAKKMFARRISRKIKIPKSACCFECGIEGFKTKLQKHHEDYNTPLDIKLICPKCHRKID